MMDAYVSLSHWGLFPCWTYPMRDQINYPWPQWPHWMYFGEPPVSYDAKYLHG